MSGRNGGGGGWGTSAARTRSHRVRADSLPPWTRRPRTAARPATADYVVGATAKDWAHGDVCVGEAETGGGRGSLGPSWRTPLLTRPCPAQKSPVSSFPISPAPPPRAPPLATRPLSVARRRGSGASAQRTRRSHSARAQRGVAGAVGAERRQAGKVR